jgi:hypothetical protein
MTRLDFARRPTDALRSLSAWTFAVAACGLGCWRQQSRAAPTFPTLAAARAAMPSSCVPLYVIDAATQPDSTRAFALAQSDIKRIELVPTTESSRCPVILVTTKPKAL